MLNRTLSTFAAVICLLCIAALPSATFAGNAIGPRGGYDFDSDHLVLGAEAEIGRVLESFRFAPSVDFELGDNSFTALNGDLRLYLFHLPESGLQFYGSAGPTLLLNNSDTELGLSLVAGLKVPMKSDNRYNIEARFGIGDIPDLKLMVTVLFGL